MGIETLNQPSYRHTCDRCGATVDAIGYDTPEGWGRPFVRTTGQGDGPWLCAACCASFEAWTEPARVLRA